MVLAVVLGLPALVLAAAPADADLQHLKQFPLARCNDADWAHAEECLAELERAAAMAAAADDPDLRDGILREAAKLGTSVDLRCDDPHGCWAFIRQVDGEGKLVLGRTPLLRKLVPGGARGLELVFPGGAVIQDRLSEDEESLRYSYVAAPGAPLGFGEAVCALAGGDALLVARDRALWVRSGADTRVCDLGDSRAVHVACSPTEPRAVAVVVDASDRSELWEVNLPGACTPMPGLRGASSPAFSEDGKHLAWAGSGRAWVAEVGTTVGSGVSWCGGGVRSVQWSSTEAIWVRRPARAEGVAALQRVDRCTAQGAEPKRGCELPEGTTMDRLVRGNAGSFWLAADPYGLQRLARFDEDQGCAMTSLGGRVRLDGGGWDAPRHRWLFAGSDRLGARAPTSVRAWAEDEQGVPTTGARWTLLGAALATLGLGLDVGLGDRRAARLALATSLGGAGLLGIAAFFLTTNALSSGGWLLAAAQVGGAGAGLALLAALSAPAPAAPRLGPWRAAFLLLGGAAIVALGGAWVRLPEAAAGVVAVAGAAGARWQIRAIAAPELLAYGAAGAVAALLPTLAFYLWGWS